jgi:glycosyltransferase involved in cell wall biosynthesis
MNSQGHERICVLPQLSGIGGMVSFHERLSAGLRDRGITVCQGLDDRPYRAVLVIGGSRQLGKLWQARRKGARIVQRLDGMNWLHRRLGTGLRHYLRAEYGNRLLGFIRVRLADRIVYQSQFARRWWEREQGIIKKPARVTYNGVDLKAYSPQLPKWPPSDRVRLLMVEGSLMGGYEIGLEHFMRLGAGLAGGGLPAHSHNRMIDLVVVGRVPEKTRRRWDDWAASNCHSRLQLNWTGIIPPHEIPAIDRSAHLLFSGDLNAACPNSVIEALACGTPVVAFDTGALPELVSPEAGCLAAYGGDPWRLDPPDLAGLVRRAGEALAAGEPMRAGARAQAETLFDLEHMLDEYVDVLLGD